MKLLFHMALVTMEFTSLFSFDGKTKYLWRLAGWFLQEMVEEGFRNIYDAP